MRRHAIAKRGLGTSCAIALSLAARTALADVNYGLLDLGTFGGLESRTYDINNSGRITGVAQNAGGTNFAFRTAPYAAVNPGTDNLGTLTGGSFSEGWSI